MEEGKANFFSESSMYTAVSVGSIATSFVLPFHHDSNLRLCPWHHLFDITCPFCGMTRGFIAISHGEIAEAVALNPASPLIYVAFLAVGIKNIAMMKFPQGRGFVWPKWASISWYIATISIFGWLFLVRMIGV